MLSLAVDTSTQSGSLAVLREERLLGLIGTSTEETYSSRLFRHLRFLLAELRLGLGQFDLFSVAAGPGSFTGLRVGLAAVKGWAEAYGKPVAAVSVLEAVATQATTPAPLLISVVDARRGQLFGAVYERRGNSLGLRGEEVVLTPEEFFATLPGLVGKEPAAVVTPTPAVVADALEGSQIQGVPVECVSPLLAGAIGRLGYRRAARGESGDALGLDANYVRRPDAEVKWKG
ncbi:MAG: tRNA (adenosine(37)-N6)-threonylcarbamoyltransferase complex dimerization subunit type 1 TsaB [Acidobacteriota bacterium]|nr:tRNA (adenosine(37)-N6)-threonylcarbamoyltransferase complex dimerization subunit type 1 TsaB [Acidobacteriota bacterium]